VTALVADLREGAEIERFNLDGSPMQIAPEGGSEGSEQDQPEPEKAE
jgi:hypothetical protein